MGREKPDGGHERRVLLVEDEPSAVRLFTMAFEETDARVVVDVAKDGQQALDRLLSGRTLVPDVVVLDLDLPKVHGVDVLQQVRENEATATLPVVVVSNETDQAIIDECYERGVNAYIVKPDDYDGLLAIVRGMSVFWEAEDVESPTEH